MYTRKIARLVVEMKLRVYDLLVISILLATCNGFNFPSNDKLKTFIDNYMQRDITIVFDNITVHDWLLRLNFPKIIINLNLNKPINLHPNASYILIIKNLISLDDSIKILKQSNDWNNRRAHLIIYTQPSLTKRDVKLSLWKLYRQHVYNSAIYRDDGVFYIWYPYDVGGECGAKVNLKKAGKINPFSKRIPKTLPGCSLNVTWNHMSVMIEDPFDKAHPGALINLLNAVARGMNVELDYLRNNSRFYTAYLRDNSYQHLVEDMEVRKIDMAVYMAYNGFVIKSLQNSKRLYQANTYILLPNRKKYLHKNYAFNLYPPSLAASLFTFLVTSTLVWRIISKRSTSISILNILQLALQGGLSGVMPTATPIRIFLMFLLLVFTCLNVVYYTQLSSVLTKPSYQPKIRSLRTLLFHTDLNVWSFHATVENLKIEESLVEAFTEKLLPMKGSAPEILKGSGRTTAAVTCVEFHLDYFKDREKLEVIYDEPLNTVLYFLAMERGHHLLETVDFWIGNVRQSGLMDKFVRDTSAGLDKITGARPLQLEKVKLGLAHLEGAFVLLCAGSLIAGVAFAFEMFYKESRWLN